MNKELLDQKDSMKIVTTPQNFSWLPAVYTVFFTFNWTVIKKYVILKLFQLLFYFYLSYILFFIDFSWSIDFQLVQFFR